MPPVSGEQVALDVATFRWNDVNLNELLHGTHGPVVTDLVRRGILVEGSVKAHASGRPGPNVITGRLRSSITWRLGVDPVSPYVDVGTAVEYARRVEEGFNGTDSLGRHYNQPPYPFLRPGLEAARASF